MSARVLIAEDEWLVAAGLQSQLERFGCEVAAVVRTGTEAVRLCAVERPDVVFMDVQMPELDGLAATRQLMEVCPHAVVIVTGNSALRIAAEEAGAMGFVVKPLLDSQVPGLLEQASQRFAWYCAVRDEAGSGDPALQAWQAVRRALQQLVAHHGRAEAAAFSLLQQRAGDRCQSLREAAEEVLAQANQQARNGEDGAA